MSATISIPGYPLSNRAPGVFAVVDASKANQALFNQVTLLLGQKLTAGSATAGDPIVVGRIDDAIAAFGSGSQLAIMYERYRALDSFGTVYCLPLADDGSGVAAVGSIAFTGPATAAGVIPLYIDGYRIPVGVASGAAATAVVTSMVAAINAWTSPFGQPLPYVAAVDGVSTSKLNITARNAGTLGNQATINFSLGGPLAGDGVPGSVVVPGLVATVTAFASGATDPSLTAPLANLPSQPFDFICCPYNDTTSLDAIKNFLGDTGGRWNWASMLYGGAFSAKNGTLSARTTFGLARNDQHVSVIGANKSPSPDWHWAVDYTAASAVTLRSDPAVPVGGLAGGMQLNVFAPPLKYRDLLSERNTLLFDGMSTYIADQGGTVYVDRAITTHQVNAAGQPDTAYLNVNVLYELMSYIRQWRTMIQSNFNRRSLVNNGARIPVGSAMVTPDTIKFATIAQYRTLCDTGLVGDPAGFAAECAAENAGLGVVRMLLPVRLANQLEVVAANIQFRSL